MRLFNPFGANPTGMMMPPIMPQTNGAAAPAKAESSAGPTAAPAPGSDAAIEDLKRKLDELQNQLTDLSKKP